MDTVTIVIPCLILLYGVLEYWRRERRFRRTLRLVRNGAGPSVHSGSLAWPWFNVIFGALVIIPMLFGLFFFAGGSGSDLVWDFLWALVGFLLVMAFLVVGLTVPDAIRRRRAVEPAARHEELTR